MQAAVISETSQLVDRLGVILQPDRVITDPKQLTFFSTDMFTHGELAEVVIKPGSTHALASALALCTQYGRAVVPRGGGFSYTSGYIPTQGKTVVVDLRDLNHIVEINAEDLYVTVECGCTWEKLYSALKEKGLRTPFMGPASGYWSTIGGNLSQGGFFYGSTQFGTGADIVLGLEVVLADGTILTTGSGGSTHTTSPFLRYFGPDLTGLFLNDTGAMGFKTKATLKLMPIPQRLGFATFVFDNIDGGLASLSMIARAGIAAEAYMWDPVISKGFAARNSLSDDLKYLGSVARSGSSLKDGLKGAMRMALAGKRIFNVNAFMLHVVVEDQSEAAVDAKLARIRAITVGEGGGEVEPSAPRATRALPFSNFVEKMAATSMNRNLPVHGLFPHSKALGAAKALTAMLDAEKSLMDQHGVTYGTIYFAVGANAISVEPLLFWKDQQLALHDRAKNQSDLEGLRASPERPAATRAVSDIRKRMLDIVEQHGGCFFQIGKDNPYRDLRQPQVLALLDGIKALVDPGRNVNPGSLGF